MIAPAGDVRILLAVDPVDFRKGIDGLAAVVQERLGRNPFSGELFVFRAKRADRVKILMWDGTGAVLYHKRLEQGRFCWPRRGQHEVVLTQAQLAMLLEGLDCWRVQTRKTKAPFRAV